MSSRTIEEETLAISTQTCPRPGARVAERRAEEHVSSAARDGPGDEGGDLHAGGVEDAGLDEGGQHRDLVEHEGPARHGSGPAPSKRSLRAVTRLGGTRQAKTPYGLPATVGVAGPAIPRTKR